MDPISPTYGETERKIILTKEAYVRAEQKERLQWKAKDENIRSIELFCVWIEARTGSTFGPCI